MRASIVSVTHARRARLLLADKRITDRDDPDWWAMAGLLCSLVPWVALAVAWYA